MRRYPPPPWVSFWKKSRIGLFFKKRHIPFQKKTYFRALFEREPKFKKNPRVWRCSPAPLRGEGDMNYVYEMLLSFYVRRDSFLPDPPLLLCVTWLISTRCSSSSVCDVTHAHEILLSFLIRTYEWVMTWLMLTRSSSPSSSDGASSSSSSHRHISARGARVRVEGGACAGTTPCVLFESAPQRNTPSHMLCVTCTTHSQGGPMWMSRVACVCVMCHVCVSEFVILTISVTNSETQRHVSHMDEIVRMILTSTLQHRTQIVRMIPSHKHTATQNTFSQAHCNTEHILTSTLQHRTQIVRMIHSHKHTATQNTFSQAHCNTEHILTSTMQHRTQIVRMIHSHKHTATQNTFSHAHCNTEHILTSTLQHRTQIVRMILSHKHTATQNTFMFVWHDRAFCVGWLNRRVCVTCIYACHDSFMCVTGDFDCVFRLVSVFSYSVCVCVSVIWLMSMGGVPRSSVWHDSLICVTWLIHLCDMTHASVWHDSFICVTCHIHVCDMTHANVWHDSFRCVI